jgi:hypothetical protein
MDRYQLALLVKIHGLLLVLHQIWRDGPTAVFYYQTMTIYDFLLQLSLSQASRRANDGEC